jgi:hypothetical protein
LFLGKKEKNLVIQRGVDAQGFWMVIAAGIEPATN